MEYRLKQEKLFELIEPVVSGMGLSIVDLSSTTIQKRLHVHLVLYKEDGISLDDCAKVHRTIVPRIEMAQENRDVYLEVGSPGLNRNMKCADEFEIFIGRGARILQEDSKEWESGILGGVENGSLSFFEINETGEKELKLKIKIENIRKAKLDDTQEIGR